MIGSRKPADFVDSYAAISHFLVILWIMFGSVGSMKKFSWWPPTLLNFRLPLRILAESSPESSNSMSMRFLIPVTIPLSKLSVLNTWARSMSFTLNASLFGAMTNSRDEEYIDKWRFEKVSSSSCNSINISFTPWVQILPFRVNAETKSSFKAFGSNKVLIWWCWTIIVSLS